MLNLIMQKKTEKIEILARWDFHHTKAEQIACIESELIVRGYKLHYIFAGENHPTLQRGCLLKAYIRREYTTHNMNLEYGSYIIWHPYTQIITVDTIDNILEKYEFVSDSLGMFRYSDNCYTTEKGLMSLLTGEDHYAAR